MVTDTTVDDLFQKSRRMNMETRITARHFKASPKLHEYISKRMGKLERFYDGITDAHVILHNKNGHLDHKIAEITINVYRQKLTAQHTAGTLEEAIDECVDRLRRKLLKYKSKLRSNGRGSTPPPIA